MRINLCEIIEMPGKSLPFSCELETERLMCPSIKTFLSSPEAEGEIVNTAGALTLLGTLRSDMLLVCDRCGCEYDSVKETQLEATIVEEDTGVNPELFVLEGDGVNLTEIVETLFILDMETKFLCREDCKGLCSACGRNLNLGPCGCRKQIDPRFAVLEQLLDK